MICGTAQSAKEPILTRDLKLLMIDIGDNLKGIRDRALLLGGVCRRIPSE
jgi:hypothetical protein